MTKFGKEIYRLTSEQKTPKEIANALEQLGYFVMKIGEKKEVYKREFV